MVITGKTVLQPSKLCGDNIEIELCLALKVKITVSTDSEAQVVNFLGHPLHPDPHIQYILLFLFT